MKDRFGRDTLPPVRQWGWTIRTCTGCGEQVDVFEVPAGYLDDPYWGAYRCGMCGGQGG